MPKTHGRDEIKVTVSFSMSEEKAFEERYDPATILAVARKAAMAHFSAEEDPNHVYYLTFERERRDDNVTIGSLAQNRAAIKFRLIKEITQG
jgi:hypothetical protein